MEAIAKPGSSFILEIKKASPSAGAIREADAGAIARGYAGVADALSVLTDRKYFGGSIDDVAAARTEFAGPILAKDFFIDPRQVVEARLAGADAVLVMLSLLDDARAQGMIDEARRLGMDVLVEVHDEAEMRRALALGAPLIGINNRDLRDLTIDLATTERLGRLASDRLLVSESGIHGRSDVERLSNTVDGFLVGSALMRSEKPAEAARELVFGRVKLCGLTTAEDVRCGRAANFAGFVFAPGEPAASDRREGGSAGRAGALLRDETGRGVPERPAACRCRPRHFAQPGGGSTAWKRGRRICARSSPPVAAVVRDLDCRECRAPCQCEARRRPRPLRQRQWRHGPHVRLGCGAPRSPPAAVDCRRRDRTRERARGCGAGHLCDRRRVVARRDARPEVASEDARPVRGLASSVPAEAARMRLDGRFGRFGGTYVPEILVPALEQLEAAFLDAQDDAAFQAELGDLLANYAGRPTPLTRCRNLPGNIYLKREDLLHGGAHKTNQVLAQGLLAKRMGKRRLIAETGAGQHGVATAIVGALLGFETVIYMGAEDVERQALNVFRMRLMGAEVVPVESGGRTLKDAINEALRDWSASFEHTHYLLGTAAGPHPFPTMVREFQRVIGREARAQIIKRIGRLPDAVIACVGGGSNAIGLFADFIPDDVRLIGVEAAGRGLAGAQHGATFLRGRPGVLHGLRPMSCRTKRGRSPIPGPSRRVSIIRPLAPSMRT